MSQYTTGEVAKHCGITVRTVQYYDSRGILPPSQLSEGGRRLYSEEDLQKMKMICFLRELGMSISTISQLLQEEHPEKVVDLLLCRQEKELREEIAQRQEKLDKLTQLQKIVKNAEDFRVERIGDMATEMTGKKKLRKVRWNIALMAIAAELLEVGTILLWVLKDIWWPFAFIGAPALILFCVFISIYYFRNVAYICPECRQVFSPKFKEAFFANHTPTTRKLTCPHCGHKGFCVETYKEK